VSGHLLAEFETAHDLLKAAQVAAEAHHPPDDALTPNPVEEISKHLSSPHREKPIGWVQFVAGAIGGCVGYAMQWYSASIDYPILSGGRPFNSWQVFVIVPYEATILFAATFGVLAWIWMCGLPKLHHPLFAAPIVRRAVQDRYLLLFPLDNETGEWIAATLVPVAVYEAHT
jgi:hypothetical protein